MRIILYLCDVFLKSYSMTAIELINLVKPASESLMEKRNLKTKQGVFFNIFKELRMESDEVRLHSRFLASMLNPCGSHGQGDLFLKSFVEMISTLNEKNGKTITFTSTTCVEVEKVINGGRIDLYISDLNNEIIIENKIFADDQVKQMQRYKDFADSQKKNSSILIYLTLDGREPSEQSCGSLQKDGDYICMSYKDNIVRWLKECIKYVNNDACSVKEIIKQYIKTIDSLTNKDMEMTQKMDIDVLETLSNNIDVVFDIISSRNDLVEYIINKKFLPELKKLAECKGFEMKDFDRNWMSGKPWKGLRFSKKEWKHVDLYFEFDQPFVRKATYGFFKRDVNEKFDSWDCLKERYAPDLVHSTGQSLIKYTRWLDWNTRESLKELLDGTILNEFDSFFNDAIECAKDLEV